eukprot:365219-Chlamydomonas_euryale.AAC.22
MDLHLFHPILAAGHISCRHGSLCMGVSCVASACGQLGRPRPTLGHTHNYMYMQIVMILWTYFAAVSTDPGRVPAGWHPFADDQQAAAELERLAYSDYYVGRHKQSMRMLGHTAYHDRTMLQDVYAKLLRDHSIE